MISRAQRVTRSVETPRHVSPTLDSSFRSLGRSSLPDVTFLFAMFVLTRAPACAPSTNRRRAATTKRTTRLARIASVRAASEDVDSTSDDAEPSPSMLEFAESGFPSDEDDVMDPRARYRAMNKVVDEIHELNKAEEEVLNKAFKLVEKFGLKRKTTSE